MSEKYPRGKLCDDDDGELEFRIGVRDKTVIIDFGKPVIWFGMDAARARELAARLIECADDIDPARAAP